MLAEGEKKVESQWVVLRVAEALWNLGLVLAFVGIQERYWGHHAVTYLEQPLFGFCSCDAHLGRSIFSARKSEVECVLRIVC